MQIRDVLELVPGLNKRFLYYLEAQGYIKPRLIQKPRLSRRDYSEEDVTLIREVFSLYDKGYSPRAAIRAAQRSRKDASADVMSLKFAPCLGGARKASMHAGEGEDSHIEIVPKTEIVVTAEKTACSDCFSVRVSVHLSGQEGPFLVRFRHGEAILCEVETDVHGTGSVSQLSESQVKALIGCSVQLSRGKGPDSRVERR